MKSRYNLSRGDFICMHCRQYVSAASILSGVIHRNHCPYCLWSRHLDYYTPGDRLSACKEPMKPIGLTLKRTAKKYTRQNQGELMLVHHCTDCGSLSINRIAADDISEAVYEIYQSSFHLEAQIRTRLQKSSVHVLDIADRGLVESRLFGGSRANVFSEPIEDVFPDLFAS